MNNLLKRTVFGALYVAVIVTSLLFLRPYYFQLLFLVVSVLAVREYYHINHADTLLTVCGMVLTWLMFLVATTMWLTTFYSWWLILIALYGFVLILSLTAELFKKAADPIRNWGLLLSGQVFVALPFSLMNPLFDRSPMLLLALFVIIWTNDTGAYCVGSLFGRHRMFVRVSPKKSWEGFAGGAVFAMLAGWIFFADPFGFTSLTYSWWKSLVLSLVIVIFGTLGDLTESLTKRTLGIKDSGNVIPGHGGWLDRFDSILLSTPALLLTLLLLEGLEN